MSTIYLSHGIYIENPRKASILFFFPSFFILRTESRAQTVAARFRPIEGASARQRDVGARWQPAAPAPSLGLAGSSLQLPGHGCWWRQRLHAHGGVGIARPTSGSAPAHEGQRSSGAHERGSDWPVQGETPQAAPAARLLEQLKAEDDEASSVTSASPKHEHDAPRGWREVRGSGRQRHV